MGWQLRWWRCMRRVYSYQPKQPKQPNSLFLQHLTTAFVNTVFLMNYTQGVACRSQPHVIHRRVRLDRSFVTWNTPVSSSYHSYQPVTTTSNAEPTGTLVEASSRSSSTPEHPAQSLALPSLEQFLDINHIYEYRAVMQRVKALEEQPSHSPSARAVMQQAKAMVAQVVALWKPRVCHTAVQILLHIRDKDDVQTTPSNYFAQLAEAKDSRLQRVAGSLGMELAQLGKDADAVLARNKGAYLESFKFLKCNIYLLRGSITTAMKRACPEECRIVEAFEAFQLAFPERFTEVSKTVSCPTVKAQWVITWGSGGPVCLRASQYARGQHWPEGLTVGLILPEGRHTARLQLHLCTAAWD